MATPGNSISSFFSGLGSGLSTPAVPNVSGSAPTFNPASYLASAAPAATASPFAGGTPAVPNISGAAPAAKAPTTGGMSYVIQPGDTLDNIAAAHGTTVAALLAANPSVTNPNLIQAGAGLSIPGTNSPAVPAVPGTTPANLAASNPSPSLAGHAVIPTSDGTGTVNSNTGAYTPTTNTTNSPAVPAYTPASGSSPTPTYTGATGALLSTNSANPATSGAGVAGYDQAVENLAQFETGLQGTLGNIGQQAIPMPFIQGQQQVVNTENAGVLSALQGAVTQAQTGVGLGIQGQQTQNTGLAAAGQLTQPTANASYFGTPENGSVIGSSFPEAMQQYAQMAASGQYGAIPSSITGNPVLSAQLNAAAKQINPNYSPVTSAAQSSATASNVATGGEAATNAANTGYQQAVQDYASMTTMNGQASTQAQQVQGLLSSLGLNQGVPDYNSAINTLSTKLGGTGYTQLTTAMTELQNMYSQFLATGGSTPTGSENQALALLNPNSSGSQINAAIGQLNTAMYNRLNAQYGKLSTFSTNLGTSGAGTPAPAGTADGNSPFSTTNFFPTTGQ